MSNFNLNDRPSSMSPMTVLSFSLQEAHVSPLAVGRSSSSLRRSPPRGGKVSLSSSSSRRRDEENYPNGASPVPASSSAGTQFDMSPSLVINRRAPSRAAVVASPVPIFVEGSQNSDTESTASLSRSSSLSEDDGLRFAFRPVAAAAPGAGAAAVVQQPNQRNFLSMSANIPLRKSPVEELKTSPVKKTLFSLQEDEQEDVEEVPLAPHRWERSASASDLVFVAPSGQPSGLKVSPRISPSMISSKPTTNSDASVNVFPITVPIRSLSQSQNLPSLSSMLQENSGRIPLRLSARSASTVGSFLPRSTSLAQVNMAIDEEDEDDMSLNEKKRGRAARLPAPFLPDGASQSACNSPSKTNSMHEVSFCTLPLVHNLKHDGLNVISCTTVRDIVQGGPCRAMFRHVFILDCRFDYEYEGGHIMGAIHANNPQVLVEEFFKKRLDGRCCFIFHCEFSSKRGPSQLRLMRELDRKANQDNYPNLFYPELYLMENGYCEFFARYPEFCSPQEYIKMEDDRFRDRLRGNLAITKTMKKKRKSFSQQDL